MQALRLVLQPSDPQGLVCTLLPLQLTRLLPEQSAARLSGLKLKPSLQRESRPFWQLYCPTLQVWQAPVAATQPSGQKVSGPKEFPSELQVRLELRSGVHSRRLGKQKSQRWRAALHRSARRHVGPKLAKSVCPALHFCN